MLDVLGIISNSLDQENMINFRAVCKLYDKVFNKHWVKHNNLKLYNTHFTSIPELFKDSNIILTNCCIDRDLIFDLPPEIVLRKTKIYDYTTDNTHIIDYECLDRIGNLNFTICNCGHESFCGKEICSGLEFWLPEYINITTLVPDCDYVDKILDQHNHVMSDDCRNNIFDLLSTSELDRIYKLFLSYLLCLRNVNDKNGIWTGMKRVMSIFVTHHIHNNEYEEEIFTKFFEYCDEKLPNP